MIPLWTCADAVWARRVLEVSSHQTLGHAAAHHSLEHMAQDIALPEPTMAVAREGGMIGNLTIQSQAAKPSIGEIQVNLFAQPPLGADGEAIADNEHPDHQLRVDRGSANLQ